MCMLSYLKESNILDTFGKETCFQKNNASIGDILRLTIGANGN